MEQEQMLLTQMWWEKLQPLVRKFTRETLLIGLEDQDIRQECFLLLQKALCQYKEEMGISFAYYYKVVLSGWRANRNKKNKHYELNYQAEQLLFIKDERVDVAREVEQHLEDEALKEAIEHLQALEQQIIRAYYLENKRLKDIALEIGMPYKTIEYKKKGALRKLKEQLQRDI